MNNLRLFKLVLGFKPSRKNTEQHDVFFGIGTSIRDFQKEIKEFLPEARGKVHIDTWEEINQIDGYSVDVIPREQKDSAEKLFFVNAGWYPKAGDREEHATIFVVANNTAEASALAKETRIFKELVQKGFQGGNAATHLDDKFAPDDIFDIEQTISKAMIRKYAIKVQKSKYAYRSNNDLEITGFLKVSDLHNYKLEKGGF